MNRIWNRYGAAVLFVAVVIGSLAVMSQLQPAFGHADKAAVGGEHYLVVSKDAHYSNRRRGNQ